jgi:hypothetical protein
MEAPKNYCTIKINKLSLDVLPIIYSVAFVLWMAKITLIGITSMIL